MRSAIIILLVILAISCKITTRQDIKHVPGCENEYRFGVECSINI